MANGKFLVGKPSGGVTTVTVADGSTNTNLVLPESGTVSGVTTAVTDNAIARYDGTTGKLQNSGVIIDDGGNLGVGGSPYAKLSTLCANNNIAETVFMAGILGVTNGFMISKDSVANPNYKFLTTNQATGLEIDSKGSVLLKAGTGALGYGAGAGGSVTQLTSKNTAVTLNKPSGKIAMHNSTILSGEAISFYLNNSLLSITDQLFVTLGAGEYSASSYSVWGYTVNGLGVIFVKNTSGTSLSEPVTLNFAIIKGSNS